MGVAFVTLSVFAHFWSKSSPLCSKTLTFDPDEPKVNQLADQLANHLLNQLANHLLNQLADPSEPLANQLANH